MDKFDDNFWDDNGAADGGDAAATINTNADKKPAASTAGSCPNCGSRAIESLGPSGSSVCTDCGIIVEENTIVSSVEFVEGAGGASHMVGQIVGANSTR
eukprot:scaffold15653_cov107-Skeletonema_dohrnii-CCMP3373.AAC.1